MKKGKYAWIRYVYLYLVTVISIIVILISTIGLVNLVLDEFVFDVQGWEELNVKTDCEWELSPDNLGGESRYASIAECEDDKLAMAKIQHSNGVKNDLSDFLAMLIIALPLYLYHWGIIRRESKN